MVVLVSGDVFKAMGELELPGVLENAELQVLDEEDLLDYVLEALDVLDGK